MKDKELTGLSYVSSLVDPRKFEGMVSYIEIASMILEEGQELVALNLIRKAKQDLINLGFDEGYASKEVYMGIGWAAGQLGHERGNEVLKKLKIPHPYFGERIPENPRDAFREGLKYGASQDATRVP